MKKQRKTATVAYGRAAPEFISAVEAKVAHPLPARVVKIPACVDTATWTMSHNHAWLSVAVALDALASDQFVKEAPVVADFVRVMRALVSWSSTAEDAREVLARIDELLPSGEIGARHRKAQAARRRGMPGTYEARQQQGQDRDKRVRAWHARLVASDTPAATQETADAFGISTRTVQRILKASRD